MYGRQSRDERRAECTVVHEHWSEETMPSDVELTSKNLLGDNSIVVPPDPIPNSEVKRNRADGSVGSPHVRVGHRQAPK